MSNIERILELEAEIKRLSAEIDERAVLLLESTQAGCALTDEVSRLESELAATKLKMEAAEKRIRESQEQEPVAWIWKHEDEFDTEWKLSIGSGCPTFKSEYDTLPLYVIPPIPNTEKE